MNNRKILPAIHDNRICLSYAGREGSMAIKMDLLELRGKIDEIDEQIVALYERRMDISRQVAEYKIGTGKKVFDKADRKSVV